MAEYELWSDFIKHPIFLIEKNIERFLSILRSLNNIVIFKFIL